MPIDIDSLGDLSQTKIEKIKNAHERIERALAKAAELFPTDAHFLLSITMRMLSGGFHPTIVALNGGEKKHIAELIHALNFEKKVNEITPFVWLALVEAHTKKTWSIIKKIADPPNVLKYVRSIAWRFANNEKKIDRKGDDLLLDIFPIKDDSGNLLDPIGSLEDETARDFEDLELWLTIEQQIKNNKSIKPDRTEDIVALIRARVFFGATKKSAPARLKWSQKKVETVWKEIQRKDILKKIRFS